MKREIVKLNVDLVAGHETLGRFSIRLSYFLGDSFSSFLFLLALIPLTMVLKKISIFYIFLRAFFLRNIKNSGHNGLRNHVGDSEDPMRSKVRWDGTQSNLYFAAADEVTREKSWEWLKQWFKGKRKLLWPTETKN